MTTFNDNTSLFEIKKHFHKLNMKSSLDFEQWIIDGNTAKIHLHIEPMDQVREVLKHLKIELGPAKYCSSSEVSIGNEHEFDYLKKRLFRKNIFKKRTQYECYVRIHRYETRIILDVYKKEHMTLAERISVEIVNYIGNECHINLRL